MSPFAETAPRPSPKRDQLLDTAERLFYRDGYRAIGIDSVLAEAGVAKMTLYHHFASKEELIVAVLERRSARLREQVAQRLEAAGRTPRKRLLALFDWYADWFQEPDFRGCALIRAAAEFPDPDSVVHQTVERIKAQGLARLTALLQEMGVRTAAAVAQQVFLLLEGSIVRAHTTGDAEVAALAKRAALTLIEAHLEARDGLSTRHA